MDIVVGGSGLIGHHLVKELIRHGREVKVFDLHAFPKDEDIVPSETVLGNILDFEAICNAVKGCERVFHLAAIPYLWDRNPKVFNQVNYQGTENVIEAARQAHVERLVYTSTESILAPRHHKGLITEDTQACLDDMIGPYCRAKFLAEQSIFKLAREGFPAIVVCPTMPIGPGDWNLTPPGRMISRFLQRKIPGYIDCTLNFVDVRDAALGHYLAAEKGEPGRRYILSGHNLTLEELFSLLSHASGIPAPRFKVPYLLALTGSYIEEWICKLTGKMPQSSVTGVKLCRRSLAFNGSKTWELLGHTPRPIEESIRDAVRWHQKRLAAL